MAIGSSNTDYTASADLRQRNTTNGSASKVVVTEVGREVDKRLDSHQNYEFGGPWGVVAIMTGFPILMYYLWICLWFYDGALVYPTSVEDIQPFLWRMWGHVAKDASPNAYAWKVYSGNFFFQLFIAWVIPGYKQKTLMYNCNALLCLYTTLITAAALHYYNIFRLTEIIDNYGHLMSVSMIYGFGMWAEVRIPWVIVFFLSVSGACKQYEQYGYVTPNMAFMILATGFYINACAKGEECIPQTWDMFHEKWGFMVIFWNFSGVPFVIHFFASVLTSFWLSWDTAMAQKSHFKMQTQGITKFRKTFPQLPGSTVKNPTFIQTAHG
ncbi:ergosterol biosynthesis ERG4/ERG24 [Flammula alnicola]|nr:ergosterol biosynthesis ERG4/ERG24 [Flammula alnicola]